ncbi:hypothetical protein [Sulfobacillus thermosulfidooxidans]|uniref:hypothetical protein n=1 Tax=Sulfobacillus thermosulfidooxidans TaxID=28034 RepID=UPI00130119CA|nr:hypothetical protein [Sulfobacillus thermosulfidooxidans]
MHKVKWHDNQNDRVLKRIQYLQKALKNLEDLHNKSLKDEHDWLLLASEVLEEIHHD